MMRTREFQWSWQGQNLVLGVDEAGDHRGGHADSQRKRCDADYNGSAHATSPLPRPSHPTSLNGDQSFSFPVFDTGSISARGKRSTAGPARQYSYADRADASAYSYSMKRQSAA